MRILRNITKHISVEPVLRWAGGKRWILPHLRNILKGVDYDNYVEPFFGGGAVFFNIIHSPSLISDANAELINTYNQIKERPDLLIEELSKLPQNKEQYLKIRKINYENDLLNAVRFIYLNKTSFNGLYRVNSKGEYNVPYGKKYFSIDGLAKKIKNCSEKLKNTNIKNCDFDVALEHVNEKSLVYLDPPYTVTHNNNGFINYNEKIFSVKDQKRLANSIDKIDEIGAKFILSNANHEIIDDIFLKNYNKLNINRNSLIGANTKSRGLYSEVIITNIKL